MMACQEQFLVFVQLLESSCCQAYDDRRFFRLPIPAVFLARSVEDVDVALHVNEHVVHLVDDDNVGVLANQPPVGRHLITNTSKNRSGLVELRLVTIQQCFLAVEYDELGLSAVVQSEHVDKRCDDVALALAGGY